MHTITGVPKLPTDNHSIIWAPRVVTDCTPDVAVADFDTTFHVIGTTNQLNGSLYTHWMDTEIYCLILINCIFTSYLHSSLCSLPFPNPIVKEGKGLGSKHFSLYTRPFPSLKSSCENETILPVVYFNNIICTLNKLQAYEALKSDYQNFHCHIWHQHLLNAGSCDSQWL